MRNTTSSLSMLKNNIPLQVSITRDACGAVHFSSVMLLKIYIFDLRLWKTEILEVPWMRDDRSKKGKYSSTSQVY